LTLPVLRNEVNEFGSATFLMGLAPLGV